MEHWEQRELLRQGERLRDAERDVMRDVAPGSIALAALGAALIVLVKPIWYNHYLMFMGISILALNTLLTLDFLFQENNNVRMKLERRAEDKPLFNSGAEGDPFFWRKLFYRKACRLLMWVGVISIIGSFFVAAVPMDILTFSQHGFVHTLGL